METNRKQQKKDTATKKKKTWEDPSVIQTLESHTLSTFKAESEALAVAMG